MAHEQGPVAVVGIVVVELVEPRRVCPRGLDLKPVTPYPVAKARFLTTFEAETRGLVVVVDDVSVRFSSIVPEEGGVVLLTIKGHRDLLVTLADGGGFKLGDALLEIGAAIAAKIGSFDRPVSERADKYSGCGSSKHAVTQTQSPKHIAALL